jgi:hypothetical protein
LILVPILLTSTSFKFLPTDVRYPSGNLSDKAKIFRSQVAKLLQNFTKGMNERDERLRQLIATVRQHPDGSPVWRKAMNQLLLEIQQLPGLVRSSHPDYWEILNDTLMQLGEKIKEFEPRYPSMEKSLVVWINRKLRLRYEVLSLSFPGRIRPKLKTALAEYKAQLRKLPLSLDAPVGDESGATFTDMLPDESPSTLWDLEAEIQRQQEKLKTQRIGIQMRQYIEQDPEGKLRNCYPRAYPHCHAHLLSKRRCLKDPPDKFKEIAADLDMGLTKVTSHWFDRCIPLLQKVAESFGYRSDSEI